jgi:hypothetical protein
VSIWKACEGVERLSSTVALTAQAMLETGNGQSRWLAVFIEMFLFFCFCKKVIHSQHWLRIPRVPLTAPGLIIYAQNYFYCT